MARTDDPTRAAYARAARVSAGRLPAVGTLERFHVTWGAAVVAARELADR